MCQENYFNIRIWGKSTSGGAGNRPIGALLAERFYISLAGKVISISLLLNQSWAKGTSYAFDIENPWTRQAHFE